MSLSRLLNQRRIKPHRTSKAEIHNLLRLVKRDIRDSNVKELSPDRKFAIAYNAVLQSATILLYCSGYKPQGIGHHFTVFEAMKEIMGKEHHKLADYFDSCRAKRNITDYSNADEISETEAQELIEAAEDFLKLVTRWLKTNHPNLFSSA